MKPPADLPLEIVLLVNRFANRLGIPQPDLWAMLYGQMPKPPGWAAAWAEEFEPLTSPATYATNATMDARTISAPIAGRPHARPDHPLVVALRKKGVTLVELAKELKRSRASIQSWMLPDGNDNRRPIPEDAVKYLQAKYGVKPTAWAKK